jgi:hypothetical protein
MRKFTLDKKLLCLAAVTSVSIIVLILGTEDTNAQTIGNLTSLAAISESVKINTPAEGNQVPINEDLIISGESSDDATKDCGVSVIVNNVKPYHDATASGPTGSSDYSEWNYTLGSNYTQVKEGSNRITAKLLCSPEITKWYSVSVMGYQTNQPSANISIPTLSPPSMINLTNTSSSINSSTDVQPQ